MSLLVIKTLSNLDMDTSSEILNVSDEEIKLHREFLKKELKKNHY